MKFWTQPAQVRLASLLSWFLHQPKISIEEFTPLRDQWIRNAKLAIIVFSVVSRSSLEQVDAYVQQVRRVKGERAVFCLVGNKIDLRPIVTDSISKEEGIKLANRLNCPYFECSAKTFEGRYRKEEGRS